MRNDGYYTEQELKKLGIQFGENVLISSKVSIYGKNIQIGNNVRIDDFCILTGDIKIGSFVHIAAFSLLSGSSGIVLEDFVNLSSRVSIFSQSDDYSGEYMTNPMVACTYTNVMKGEIVIKKHVIIGAGSVVLPQTTLYDGTAIGALSLVNKDTDAWSIYAGVPAKKIKTRKQNVLDLEKKFVTSIVE